MKTPGRWTLCTKNEYQHLKDECQDLIHEYKHLEDECQYLDD